MSRTLAPIVVLAAAVFSGCFDPRYDNPTCSLAGECPDGLRCVDGVCRTGATIDADLGDGAIDAPIPDAAFIDAPGVDAPPPPPFCDGSDPLLLACYRFESDVVAAQPHDESLHGNSGNQINATFEAGRPGRGLALAVSAVSQVSVPDNPSLIPGGLLTLEMWVKAAALPPAAGRAGLVDNNGSYAMFVLPDGRLRCSTSSPTVEGGLVVVNQWTHVACVFDGGTLLLYQDGVLAAQLPTTLPVNGGGTDGMRIGQNSPSGDPLSGWIDDLRIWDRAFTAQQVCESAGC